jgi:tetratricopeptide (TPR) repeat protein
LLAAGVILVALLLSIGVFLRFWYRGPAPIPPDLDLEKVDPEVARAVTNARHAVTQSPRSPSAWGDLSMVFAAHNFTPQALRCFDQTERLAPKDAQWPYLHGIILLPDDPDAAIGKFARAVELNPGDATMRLRLAETMFQQGRPEAEEQFRSALRRDPDNPRAHLGLARLSLSRGDLDEAQEHLTVAVSSRHARKAAHSLLAELALRRGDQEAASQELQIVRDLPIDPIWPDALLGEMFNRRVGKEHRRHLASQMMHDGKIREAAAILETAVAEDPGDGEAWNQLGQIRIREKDFPAAQQVLRKAIQATPGAAGPYFFLGLALYEDGKYSDAAASFRDAISRNSGMSSAHYYLGKCLLKKDDRKGALEEFRLAVRFNPQEPTMQRELGELLAAEGLKNEALEHLHEALRLKPGDQTAKELIDRLSKP